MSRPRGECLAAARESRRSRPGQFRSQIPDRPGAAADEHWNLPGCPHPARTFPCPGRPAPKGNPEHQDDWMLRGRNTGRQLRPDVHVPIHRRPFRPGGLVGVSRWTAPATTFSFLGIRRGRHRNLRLPLPLYACRHWFSGTAADECRRESRTWLETDDPWPYPLDTIMRMVLAHAEVFVRTIDECG